MARVAYARRVITIAQSFRTGRTLWFAIVVSTTLFLAMLQYLRVTGAAPHAQVPPGMVFVLALVAVGTATASVLVPTRVLAARVRRLEIKVVDEIGEPVGSFRESAPVRRVVADPESAVRAALAPYQSTLVLGLALAESVALYGFMLGYLGAPAPVFLPFFVVSWALMATKIPKPERVTRVIASVTGAECRL